VKRIGRALQFVSVLAFAAALAGAGLAQDPKTSKPPFEPSLGQAGRDVIWVPTPPSLVERMLDMAKVAPDDIVMDLGSGDGRMVIAAAKRGAQAIGVEFDERMVELSRYNAEQAGVADKAKFVQGDMYEADVSKATVLALFLLTENLDKLVPKFLALKPGTRIVLNGFRASGWEADESSRVETDCSVWCTAHLQIVPAQVAGTWRLGGGELKLTQVFQQVRGTLAVGGAEKRVEGKLRGEEITFTVDGVEYEGRVMGEEMEGSIKGGAGGNWRAVKQ
jgi:SAM-dependent methyltransferase